MKQYWILYGLFISLPEKKETWHELESYETYRDALLHANNTNQNGIIVNGYFSFKIIKRTYTDKIVFNNQVNQQTGRRDHGDQTATI